MTMHKQSTERRHADREVLRVISLFFAVRGVMRTRVAQGKKLEPSAWLRIETLKFIGGHANPSMRDVADYLSITAPSATSLVRGLIKSGLVASKTDPRDRRTLQLSLTKEGRATLRSHAARAKKALSGLFEGLSPRELAAFEKALERIRDAA